MVPWTQLREPPLWGKCLTDLTFEFTHFILVIRLSKVQQMALQFSTVFEESRCPGGPRVSRRNACLPSAFVLNSQKPLFRSNFTATVQQVSCMIRQQACPFPAGVVSLVSGEVKHIVHLIRWNSYSCLCLYGTTWTRAWNGVTHDF